MNKILWTCTVWSFSSDLYALKETCFTSKWEIWCLGVKKFYDLIFEGGLMFCDAMWREGKVKKCWQKSCNITYGILLKRTSKYQIEILCVIPSFHHGMASEDAIIINCDVCNQESLFWIIDEIFSLVLHLWPFPQSYWSVLIGHSAWNRQRQTLHSQKENLTGSRGSK